MKGMSWLLCVLQAALLGAAVYTHSLYALVCAAACLLLDLSRLLFRRAAALDTEKQKRRCRLSGLCLLPPATGIAGLSAMQIFSQTDTLPARGEIYIVCGLVAAQAGFLLLSIIKNRAEKTIAGSVARYFEIALLCALLPILVSRLLWFDAVEEWAQMVCLTGCVASGGILLLGVNMLLCSLCGYRTTRESILLIKNFYMSKRRYFYLASVGKDGVMVLAKLILSIASRSFFMFANALFSCGIGLARFEALQMLGNDRVAQLKLYRRVSFILSFAGICYVGYSIRLFFGGTPGRYDMVMALAIALYTFVEFGIQIRELVKLRKHHDIEAEALRLISLSSILISFVLTQTAIMPNRENTPFQTGSPASFSAAWSCWLVSPHSFDIGIIKRKTA